jgi:hypothetical protein
LPVDRSIRPADHRLIDSSGRASTRIAFNRHHYHHRIAIDRGVALGVVVAFDAVTRGVAA